MYDTRTITLSTTDGLELVLEAQFWIETGNAMADEVYRPGYWVEATLNKAFLGGLELDRTQLAMACGEEVVAQVESEIQDQAYEDAA